MFYSFHPPFYYVIYLSQNSVPYTVLTYTGNAKRLLAKPPGRAVGPKNLPIEAATPVSVTKRNIAAERRPQVHYNGRMKS
jgi:hypothetical protein